MNQQTNTGSAYRVALSLWHLTLDLTDGILEEPSPFRFQPLNFFFFSGKRLYKID